MGVSRRKVTESRNDSPRYSVTVPNIWKDALQAPCNGRLVLLFRNDTLSARPLVSLVFGGRDVAWRIVLPDQVMFKYPFVESGLMSCIRRKTG